MTLAELRAKVRRELRDEDPASYRWSDAELDRHIQRAVREASLAVPLEAVADLTPSGREVSLSGLSERLWVEAVEYPVGQFPPSFVRFSLWGETLTLLVDPPPRPGERVRVYYARLHEVTDTASTLPPYLEEVVTAGASGYSAVEWANFAIHRMNLGGEAVWRAYLEWGRQRLQAFEQALARLSVHNHVRSRRLYTPAGDLPRRTGPLAPGG